MIIRRFIAHLPRRQIRYLSNAQPPLLDKHCLITGGSRGIGNAIATRLALEGASCVVLSRSIAAARQAIDKLDVTWRQIHIPVQFDVAKTTRVWTSADLGGVDLSSIDILVNAAGVAQNKLLFTTPGSEIEDIIRTNLMGTIFACRTFARPMTRRKEGGCIINISSVLAARGARGSAVYAASKAGIEGLTLALATELGPKKVRMNAIRPGLIQTTMSASALSDAAGKEFLSRIPSGRLGTPDEVADAAMFLVQNEYCNGTILTVDGGFGPTL